MPVAKTCKRCGKTNGHTLDCFIAEMTLAVISEFGAGEFIMHAEGPCVDYDSALRAFEDACKPVPIETLTGVTR